MRAVLLAGGKGTRLYPYTAVLPKPLVPLGNKPVLEILISRLKSYGFDHITLCTGHLAPIIESYFGNGKKYGVKIDYSLEKKRLGTVGPLTLINDLPQTFLVANGDLLTTADFGQMLKNHQNKKADLTVGVYERQEKIELGVLKIRNGFVKDYTEKPEYDFFVSAGVYIFEKENLNLLKKNEFFDFPSMVKLLIKKNKKVIPYNIKGFWLDIGRPDDYQKAFEEFAKDGKKFLNGK